jgi:hypothetical protein
MGKQRVRPLHDEGFDGFPFLWRGMNLLTFGADGQQPFELGYMLLKREDSLCHLQPRVQLYNVAWLRDKIIGPGTHSFQVPLLTVESRQNDDVGIACRRTVSDAPAKLRTIHVRHDPIGDHQVGLCLLESGPGRQAILRFFDFEPHVGQLGRKNLPGGTIIFRQ